MANTLWTKVPLTPTSYQGSQITDKGAIMDDLTYTMDSTLINMDDMKLQNMFAPATSWDNRRYIPLLGALGDDTGYTGDSTTLTGDDSQLNIGLGGPTVWTTPIV
jgi:hypothetical protein